MTPTVPTLTPAAGVMVAAEVAIKISYTPRHKINHFLAGGPVQKRASVVFVVVVMAAAVRTVTLSAQSADPWIGTWKVNLEKSTYSPGPKPTTATIIKIEPSADGMKTTFDGMTSEGKPFHTEAVGAFDGKDNPVKGGRLPNTTRRTSASTAERLNR